VLFAVANSLWAFDAPLPSASPSRVLAFYEQTASGILVGASVSLAAIALFVLFACVLWRELNEAGAVAGAAFGGALLSAGAGLAAETINAIGAQRALDGHLAPASAEVYFEISQVFGFNAAGVGAGIFVTAAGGAALTRASVLSPRFAVGSLVLGTTAIALALPALQPLARVSLGLTLAWVFVVSIFSFRWRA
jgi:hypothetical protein